MGARCVCPYAGLSGWNHASAPCPASRHRAAADFPRGLMRWSGVSTE